MGKVTICLIECSLRNLFPQEILSLLRSGYRDRTKRVRRLRGNLYCTHSRHTGSNGGCGRSARRAGSPSLYGSPRPALNASAASLTPAEIIASAPFISGCSRASQARNSALGECLGSNDDPDRNV